MVNVYSKIIAKLKVDSTVTAQVSTRVFGLELPQTEANSMPRKCVVIKPTGGPARYGARDFVELTEVRIDVYNYGATGDQALEVQRATHDALKAISRDRQGDTLLHWAHQSSGPIWLRDPDGNWPLFLESWLVLASSTTAA